MGRAVEISEKIIDPKLEIAQALERLSKPWIKSGESMPVFSVKEISRETNLGVATIINTLSLKDGLVTDVASIPTTIFIADKNGERVNGNMESAARELAPMKRAIQASRFKSREPSNSKQGDLISTARRRRKPVIKSKLIKSQLERKVLELGRQRLVVNMQPFTEYDVKKRRDEIKAKKAQRDMKRYGISLPDVVDIPLSPEEKQQRAAEQDVASIMQYFNSIQTARPIREDEINTRFLKSRLTNDAVNLFVPWGVKPDGTPTLEIEILDIYQSLKDTLQGKGINAQIFIMPADIYATEINNSVDAELAARYFQFITENATTRGFMVKPWSEIRNENMERYRHLTSLLDDKAIASVVESPTILRKAFASAKKMSGNVTNRSIQASANAYLRERICEGIIIEEVYKPVKVGLAPKFKDDYIDGDLPRMYLFTSDKQLPWLK